MSRIGRHISKLEGNASRASIKTRGQGVHGDVESEGLEEKYQAVIDRSDSEDELVGQRWD